MNAFNIAIIQSFHSFHPLLLVVATTCGREAMRIGVRVTTKEWRSSYRMSSETNCVFYLGNLSMWTAVPYEVLKMLKILLVNLHPAELLLDNYKGYIWIQLHTTEDTAIAKHSLLLDAGNRGGPYGLPSCMRVIKILLINCILESDSRISPADNS